MPFDKSPGSPEAKAAGCMCPDADNGYGKGSGQTGADGAPLFWTESQCPLHGDASNQLRN